MAKSEKKFYAVRSGRNPGIYSSWDECKSQVDKFPYAKFKSFATAEEAAQFLRIPHKTAKPISEAKIQEHTLRVYESHAMIDSSNSQPEPSPLMSTSTSTSISLSTPSSTSIPMPSYQPSTLQRGHISSQVRAVGAKLASTNSPQPRTVVYTDGSCLGNGQNGAIAGVGVFFGHGDPRNLAEPLTGSQQTNNRAELTAAIRAIEVTDADQPLEINTDSEYLRQGITSWIQGWKKRGWKGVKNRELWETLDELMITRDVTFVYCKAHSGIEGNEMADTLANLGARKALE